MFVLKLISFFMVKDIYGCCYVFCLILYIVCIRDEIEFIMINVVGNILYC